MRWKATATYRTETGPLVIEHDIEELDELADLIEASHDWNALEDIRITLAERSHPDGWTIEDSLHA